MSDLKINNITDSTGSCGPTIAGVSTISTTGSFVVPVGPTEMRGGRGRGLFGSGATPTGTNVIDMIEIATTGDATDFGDDNLVRQEGYAAFASPTRGCFAGGLITPSPGANTTDIAYVTISSQGGVSNFGDLQVAASRNVGLSDSTRGISAGSADPTDNIIEYVTIATQGNSSTFGDLTVTRYGSGACASPTRGLIAGGSPNTNVISYITIQTKGNTETFGNLTDDPNHLAGCSNSTRGLFGGGQNPSNVNTIEYVTIATLGNAINFGDLANATDYLGACASATRGVFGGGQTPTKLDTIQFVIISSTGNTVDFGDLTVARRFCMGLSDVHGGLG